MLKKRKSSKQFTSQPKKQSLRAKRNDEKYSQAENMVLGFLYTATAPLSFAQVYNNFPQNQHSEEYIRSALDALIMAGSIAKDGKNHFKLHKNILLYEGTVTQHPKGFGFVSVTKSPAGGPTLTRDPFLSPGQMGNAHHGDTVLIRVFRIRADDRPESSVVKILIPGTNKVGGIYGRRGERPGISR